MSTHFDTLKQQNIDLIRQIKAQKNDKEKPTEEALHLLKDADKLGSSSVSIAQLSHVDNLEGVQTGFHIVGFALSLLMFCRALNDFLKGERVSFPHLSRVTIAALLVLCMVISFILPGLAAFMAVAGASLGMLTSSYHFMKHLYERFHIKKETKTLELSVNRLEIERHQLTSDVNASNSIEEQESIKRALEKMRGEQAAVLSQHAGALAKKEALTRHSVVLRCLTMLSASTTLAGAIAFLFNPLVGAILLTVGFTIGCCLAIQTLGVYAYHQFRTPNPTHTAATPSKNETEEDLISEGDREGNDSVVLPPDNTIRLMEEGHPHSPSHPQPPIQAEPILASPSPGQATHSDKEEEDGDSGVFTP